MQSFRWATVDSISQENDFSLIFLFQAMGKLPSLSYEKSLSFSSLLDYVQEID